VNDSRSTSLLTSLPPLDFPQPPKMPTFFELINAPISSEEQKPKGLFETLLDARAEVLFADAEAHPEKYSDEAKTLIEELIAGAKRFDTLPLSEQYVLDQATIDFASQPSRPKEPPPQVKTAAKEEEDEEEDEDEDIPFEGDSEADLVPFWWR
jgi:hypothetical protein